MWDKNRKMAHYIDYAAVAMSRMTAAIIFGAHVQIGMFCKHVLVVRASQLCKNAVWKFVRSSTFAAPPAAVPAASPSASAV